MFAGSIPEDLRVACILTVPFRFRVYHRVTFILGKRTSFIETVSDTLPLFLRIIHCIGSYQCRFVFLIESGGIIIIDHGRTGKNSSQLIGMQSIRQFLPMYQITAHGMSPMHIFPFPFIRVVLIEKMVFTFVKNQSVRVVDPSPASGEMKLRTVFFCIQAILPRNHIVLIDFLQSGRLPFIADAKCLSFPGRDIAEYPVVGFLVSQTDYEVTFRSTFYLECHFLPVHLVGNRKIDILLRYLQRNVAGK